jgi:hypothetical protein
MAVVLSSDALLVLDNAVVPAPIATSNQLEHTLVQLTAVVASNGHKAGKGTTMNGQYSRSVLDRYSENRRPLARASFTAAVTPALIGSICSYLLDIVVASTICGRTQRHEHSTASTDPVKPAAVPADSRSAELALCYSAGVYRSI